MLEGKEILAKAAGLDTVQAKNIISLAVDYCLINDADAHRSIDCLSDEAILYDRNKVAVIIDHDTPSGSEGSSVIQRKLINFAQKYDTIYHHGEGVGYQLMIDDYVQPGQIIAGCGEHIAVFGAVGAIGISVEPEKLAEVLQTGTLAFEVPEFVKIELTGSLRPGVHAKDIILTVIRDSGTKEIAGKMIEFAGEAFKKLTLNDRITICNLAGKTGAAGAIINLRETPDDTEYGSVYRYDLGVIEPLIVKPDHYEEIVKVNQLKEIKVNEAFIGGCSSGRIEDLRLAAKIIKGNKVAYGVRLIIAPITSDVYVQALQEGIVTDFIDAGAIVMNQGCSVCWGKSQGIIDTDEVLVSAGSFNCKGCAGAQTAKIYIASAATTAKAAITGAIGGTNSR